MKYKYWRCMDCTAKVLTNKMIRSGECLGHKIKAADIVWPWELIRIYVIWPLTRIWRRNDN